MAWEDWTYAQKGARVVFILPIIVFFIELLSGGMEFLSLAPSNNPWEGAATVMVFVLACLLSPIGYFIGKFFDKKHEEDCYREYRLFSNVFSESK